MHATSSLRHLHCMLGPLSHNCALRLTSALTLSARLMHVSMLAKHAPLYS